MSAIFGILRFDGNPVAARDLERMGAALAHRGPDGRKQAVLGPAGLGHCLMRVNAEDLFEAQPLQDRDANLTLVADLRLDNREDLAATLGIGPDALRDMPDSAVLLRAYKKWGAACAEHLLGDFAFAIWDGRNRKLVLGRDHMGQRELFYHVGSDFIAFASEIKALWTQADVPRRLNELEIARHLLQIPNGRASGGTLFDEIFGLVGAECLVATVEGAIFRSRYWDLQAITVGESRDENYYIAKYRELLTEAVACRLRRLTRSAALRLSGGFDSTAIAGLAGPIVNLKGQKLVSICQIGTQQGNSKSDIGRWIAACVRVMPHLELHWVTRDQQAPLSGVESQFRLVDGHGPTDRAAISPAFERAKALGSRLILDGIGGDYTVNPRAYAALARLLLSCRLTAFFREAYLFRRRTRRAMRNIILHDVLRKLIRHWTGSRAKQRSPTDRFVQDEFAARRDVAAIWRPERIASTKWRNRDHSPIKMRDRIVDVVTNVCDGATSGIALPAAYGLDLSRPFHDKRIVEFGLSIPEDLYFRNGQHRYLACKALLDIYPTELLSRPPGNDSNTPDFSNAIAAATGSLLDEADRMSELQYISRFIDFAAIGRELRLQSTSMRNRDLAKRNRAVKALIIARFIEWFRRDNA